MLERLHKILARAGVAALRPAEDLILQGRVTVNGRVVRELGARADAANDVIAVDGAVVQVPDPAAAHRYLMLHKPDGVISTVRDTHDRPTVLELVPNDVRIFPVGRLDANSEGLLLLTNDGDLAYRLTHPRFEIDKEYRVLVDRTPALDELRKWRSGLEFPDGERTAPAWVEVLERGSDGTWLRVVMHEGRKRQIREVAGMLGLNVLRLIRVREGPITLGDLRPGAWRELTQAEVEALRAHTQHVPSREADEERERTMSDKDRDRPRRLRVVRGPRRDDTQRTPEGAEREVSPPAGRPRFQPANTPPGPARPSRSPAPPRPGGDRPPRSGGDRSPRPGERARSPNSRNAGGRSEGPSRPGSYGRGTPPGGQRDSGRRGPEGGSRRDTYGRAPAGRGSGPPRDDRRGSADRRDPRAPGAASGRDRPGRNPGQSFGQRAPGQRNDDDRGNRRWNDDDRGNQRWNEAAEPNGNVREERPPARPQSRPDNRPPRSSQGRERGFGGRQPERESRGEGSGRGFGGPSRGSDARRGPPGRGSGSGSSLRGGLGQGNRPPRRDSTARPSRPPRDGFPRGNRSGPTRRPGPPEQQEEE